MKKAHVLLVILFLTNAFISFSQTDEELTPLMKHEHIFSFHSIIEIQKDCSVKITERIRVYAEGNNIKHGIYREIPLSYDYEGGRTDVGFKLISITRDGEKEDFHSENVDNGIRLYFGSESIFVTTGVHEYELTYVVDHVLGLFDTYDEFYWNINGTGWLFEIDTISAEVHYPMEASLVQYAGYTGSQGEDGKDFTVKTLADGMYFTTNRQMQAGENLTVAVAWEKNYLTYPTGTENLLYWIKSHFLWVLCGFSFFFILIKNFFTWYKYGRDPKPGTIMPQYGPPTGLTPAEIYSIYKSGDVNSTAFTAQLVSLATKGFLHIEVIDKSGGSKTYVFKNTHTDNKPMEKMEKILHDSLFGARQSVVFTEGAYNPLMKTVMNNLLTSIQKEHGERYRLKRLKQKGRQFIPVFLTVVLGLIAIWQWGGSPAILVGYGVLALIANVIYGVLYEQPTTEGRQILDHLEGFKLYMNYADRERIRFNNPPSMDFHHYEENLPYAIALGVDKAWSRQFDPIELQTGMSRSNYWFAGAMMMHGSPNFDFNGLSSTISSAATPPSSSSSGGGSFGGGSSGGGGGGGGGGGW